MIRRIIAALFVSVMGILAAVQPVLADGIVIPDPVPCPVEGCPPWPHPRPMSQLVIRYHHVDVKIDQQIAVTHVDQVFYNPNAQAVEGTYVFPLPADAAVSDFTLWIDGKPAKGTVLNAEAARAKYEEIVRTLKDPALLEYVGRGAIQASIFPIPPQGERRIELEYTQALTASGGLVQYRYPLNTEKFSMQPLESVRIRVEVNSSQAVRAVYSPSHPVEVIRSGERAFSASYEAQQVTPDTDFTLSYSVGESEAFHLLTYRDPLNADDPDGFFLLLLAPKPDAAAERVNKDVLLVLDRSGSMEGEKFTQAQQAARLILKNLNEGDRFYLQAFSSGIESFAPGLRPASQAKEALAWVDGLSALGSTDIHRSLLEAAAVTDPERPTYLIFMTDGLPTEGVQDSQKILDDFGRAAPKNLRMFTFGVGYDVDTILLDSLAQEHHGLSTYVQPGEALDEALSNFYARISTPVMTDLSLDFGGMRVYDLYPNPLPDLFAGTQVVLVGRYREGGLTNVRLAGKVNGREQVLRFDEQEFAADSRGEMNDLPRLWATRKIGYLLNQIRLKGPDAETIDQIVRISVRYGIVTPYTSYLVTEDQPVLGAQSQERIAAEQFESMQAAPAPEAYGADAVNKAAGAGAMSQADQAQEMEGEAAERVRAVWPRTFVLQDGVWTDTAFDPQQMRTQKVSFLSTAYFQLADARADVAAALALGERVIVVVDGQAYEVTAEGSKATPESMPPARGTEFDLPETVSPGGLQPQEGKTPNIPPAPKAEPSRTVEPVSGAVPQPSPVCVGGLLPLALVGLWLAFRRPG
ncbi:VIT domain-containing protein [Levilinea saccharolytica]|uniref:VWA domain-containing protein n=1 Tax=Levilinea saccharolytica TaxID=229921 RepID=A0A0P6YBL5_9CHLR|nr:VIT domain-containing protein [Levilinea saccharolytica]KPL90692.1 hypothetical protein ADN01_02320 [Levilinea saccharolytica]GAP18351.1 uncharacterized protein containing a von Willebrand factor type A (vWA) domain [Levilinea saccharolytica]